MCRNKRIHLFFVRINVLLHILYDLIYKDITKKIYTYIFKEIKISKYVLYISSYYYICFKQVHAQTITNQRILKLSIMKHNKRNRVLPKIVCPHMMSTCSTYSRTFVNAT